MYRGETWDFDSSTGGRSARSNGVRRYGHALVVHRRLPYLFGTIGDVKRRKTKRARREDEEREQSALISH